MVLYFGCIIRRQKSLEKSIMLGKVKGKKKKGRPDMTWIVLKSVAWDALLTESYGTTTSGSAQIKFLRIWNIFLGLVTYAWKLSRGYLMVWKTGPRFGKPNCISNMHITTCLLTVPPLIWITIQLQIGYRLFSQGEGVFCHLEWPTRAHRTISLDTFRMACETILVQGALGGG